LCGVVTHLTAKETLVVVVVVVEVVVVVVRVGANKNCQFGMRV